jgi:hypothetical protein
MGFAVPGQVFSGVPVDGNLPQGACGGEGLEAGPRQAGSLIERQPTRLVQSAADLDQCVLVGWADLFQNIVWYVKH